MGSLILGEYERAGRRLPLSLRIDDRRQHIYCVGQTGTGKTTLLTSLITQDIALGRGCALLDPHGDVAEALLDRIPRSRTDDTLYFNPADPEHVPALNLLEPAPQDERPLIAASVVATMRHVWRDSWGPRSEYIAYNGIAALLDHSARRGGISLLGLPRMFVDKQFRARVLRDTIDPKVRSMWEDEFEAWPDRLQQDAVAPLQNKLGQLLSVPAIRNVIGQATSTFSLDEVMNNRRIFIANLAKGRLGESPSSLLGSLLMTGFELAALRRQSIREEEREDFALFVDEFQNFATDSFASALSESRKFHLNLFLTHQYLNQVTEVVRSAIFGNVGTAICFRVGDEDAEALAGEFAPYAPGFLRELGRGETVMRVLRAGEPMEPMLVYTLPFAGSHHGRGRNIVVQSNMRYARRRDAVEQKIERWLQNRGMGR